MIGKLNVRLQILIFTISNFYCRYEPEDQLEWSLVLDEIKGFIKAEAAVAVLHADSNPIVLSHRYVEPIFFVVV